MTKSMIWLVFKRANNINNKKQFATKTLKKNHLIQTI